jgi:hypothetical protein
MVLEDPGSKRTSGSYPLMVVVGSLGEVTEEV